MNTNVLNMFPSTKVTLEQFSVVRDAKTISSNLIDLSTLMANTTASHTLHYGNNQILYKFWTEVCNNTERFLDKVTSYSHEVFNTQESFDAIKDFYNQVFDSAQLWYLCNRCYLQKPRFNKSNKFNATFGQFIELDYNFDHITQMAEMVKSSNLVSFYDSFDADLSVISISNETNYGESLVISGRIKEETSPILVIGRSDKFYSPFADSDDARFVSDNMFIAAYNCDLRE